MRAQLLNLEQHRLRLPELVHLKGYEIRFAQLAARTWILTAD